MERETRTFATILSLLVVLFALVFLWEWRRRTASPVATEPQATRAKPERGPSTPRRGPTCKGCGERISERAVRVENAAYHPQHFTCAHCGKPIESRYAEQDGSYFHRACLTELTAPRCAVCTETIVGQAAVRDYWGNTYHSSHDGDVPRCTYCRRFFSETLGSVGVQYEDGREVCGLCLETAVSGQHHAESLLREAVASVKRIGMFVNYDWIELHLVDRNELREISGLEHRNASGVTLFKQVDPRLDILKKLNRHIYVLHGMPEMHTRLALAHEAAHVWQGELGRAETDSAFREGSCNYAGFRMLREYDDEQAKYEIHLLMKNPDPIYGEGFRQVKRYVEANGTQAWLDRLREEDALPVGY